MKLLDFLFYFFVRLITVMRIRKFKMERIPDQAAYSITICISLWIITINGIIDFCLFDTFKSKIPNIIFVIISILIYFLIRYIYIIKGRYNKLLEKNDPKFNISDKAGRIIVIIVFASSFLLLGFIAIILHSL